MKNPNPDCAGNCRFMNSPMMTTCAYYAPVYDKNGVNVNPDRNITSYTTVCLTCNERWDVSEQCGKTTFTKKC